MTIKFFQPPQQPSCPNLSLFCTKTDILLRLSGLEFETVIQGDPTQGPKNKFPYMEDDGELIGDSTFIERHLKDKYGINFYKDVSEADQALARIITSSIEEQLYWVAVYSRWQVEDNWPIMEELFFGQMPQPMRDDISGIARQTAKSALWGHGMGRHSADEVYFLGTRLIDSLATLLADKPYFAGDKLTTVDAAAYGALINFIQNPVPTPLRAHVMAKPNLCTFLDRISDQYFPDADRVSTKSEQAA